MTRGHVQLVFCMDTEGPATDPRRSDILATWDAVDAAMDKLFDARFRHAFPDSVGRGARFGWFFLNWTGFTTNPMQRDLGYHRVRDHYLARWGERLARYGDEDCWHYHHPGPTGAANEWGFDWSASREYEIVLSRQILERGYFPVCYRAGGTIMSPTSSRWVDTWFPYDYSNRAPLAFEDTFDWSGGVDDWSIYHPDHEDFRKRGSGRRYMARCMDLDTRAYRISDEEIVAAFERARGGASSIISVFEHDYRDIEPKLLDFLARFSRIASRYSDVTWRHAAPVEAVNRYVGAAPGPRLELGAGWNGDELDVWSSSPLYQAVPWIAVQTKDGAFVRASDVLRVDDRRWVWRPEKELAVAAVGVGGSTANGQSAVFTCEGRETFVQAFRRREMPSHAAHPHSIWDHSKPFVEISDKRASGTLGETDSVQQARAFLAPRVEGGMTVLDVGCAAGHAARSLVPLGLVYRGIDPCQRSVEIGRSHAREMGLSSADLRVLALEDLPADETYDVVLCLNTLQYFPDFRLPLEIMARAARRHLVIRASFGERTDVRFLSDVLLERGFQGMRAYFNIFGRADVQAFLEREGFEVTWAADDRQTKKFGGKPESVGGVELPYEFLFARRVRPVPSEEETQGEALAAVAKEWNDTGRGGANP